MLSFFPQILFLAPAGVTLIRLAAGLAFLFIGYAYWMNRTRIAQEHFPVIGMAPVWLVSVGGLLSVAVGALLFVGLWTQVAAIFGALGALKGVVLSKRYPRVFPLPLSTNLLLLAICLSLIVSGAGAFGFDLPL